MTVASTSNENITDKYFLKTDLASLKKCKLHNKITKIHQKRIIQKIILTQNAFGIMIISEMTIK
ncbi:hypothetical protein UM89_19070 [Bacillus subtilis]|nr:hypothetical protein UM89_19070 [Bacillus subtilis]